MQGCDKEKTNATLIPVENTTEIFTNKEKHTQKKQKKINVNQNDTKEENTSPNIFTFVEKEQKHIITLDGKKLSLLNNKKSIVLVNLFKSRCTPCMSQVKSLKRLEKKYHQLRIVNLFENKKSKDFFRLHTTLNHIIPTFNSQTLPLSILYVNEVYYAHFEGQTPIEMFTYDIQQIIKKQRY
jgi:thiol-disulfide isomerase/thioredoxin